MTVKRIVTPNRWVGTAAETKPTAATHPNIRDGDTYYAYDTGILYITHDLGTTWTEKLDPSSGPTIWAFGQPELRADNNGRAMWTRDPTQSQKGTTGWQARLVGGEQTGDDWGSCYIPVNELPVTSFNSAQWTYWLTNAEVYGFNIVIWVHDPDDFNKRAEITQSGSATELEKAQYWNGHILDTTVDQFFWFGEDYGEDDHVLDGSGITAGAGTLSSWDDYQADALFGDWTIYRISIDYGWYSTGTFQAGYLCDLKLNGELIPLKPPPDYETRVVKPTTSAMYAATVSYVTATSGTALSHEGYIYWVAVTSRNNVRSVPTLKDGSSTVWVTGFTGTQYDKSHQTFSPPIHCHTNIAYTQGDMGMMCICHSYGDLLEDGGYVAGD